MRLVIASLVLLLLAACDSRSTPRTQIESAEKVREAQENVVRQQEEARKELSDAAADGDLEEVEEEKIEATEELAEAEGEVDDAKVEATENLADVLEESGEGGTYRRE